MKGVVSGAFGGSSLQHSSVARVNRGARQVLPVRTLELSPRPVFAGRGDSEFAAADALANSKKFPEAARAYRHIADTVHEVDDVNSRRMYIHAKLGEAYAQHQYSNNIPKWTRQEFQSTCCGLSSKEVTVDDQTRIENARHDAVVATMSSTKEALDLAFASRTALDIPAETLSRMSSFAGTVFQKRDEPMSIGYFKRAGELDPDNVAARGIHLLHMNPHFTTNVTVSQTTSVQHTANISASASASASVGN